MTARHSISFAIATVLTTAFTTAFTTVIALAIALPASAQEIEICSFMQPCTVSQPVTTGQQTTVPVVWRGRTYLGGDLGSDAGFFTLGDPASGEQLGVVTRPLRERLTGSADGQAVNFTFNETLTVPAEVSQRAAELGATELYYLRQFAIAGIQVTGVQTIRLIAPPIPEPPRISPNAARSLPEGREVTASGLLVRRVALRFDNGAAVASVGLTEQLRAQAQLHYDRAGLLEAVWEVATPASTRGQPVFRRLENVRQYLGAGQQATLQSPVLPTDEAGLYLLRLRLIQPSLERELIDLRYQVSGQAAESAFVPVLRFSQPHAGSSLDAETEFHWRRVANTRAYQLELYDQPPSAAVQAGQPEPNTAPAEMTQSPTTGMVLKGSTDRARLTPAVLQRLRPGHTYYWRVIAVNTEGAVVAASPVQSIQTPE